MNDEEHNKLSTESRLSKHFLIDSLPNYMSVFKKWKFSKYISVFGVNIIAVDTVPNRIHQCFWCQYHCRRYCAKQKDGTYSNVMTQYPDNDENGITDELLILSYLTEMPL